MSIKTIKIEDLPEYDYLDDEKKEVFNVYYSKLATEKKVQFIRAEDKKIRWSFKVSEIINSVKSSDYKKHWRDYKHAIDIIDFLYDEDHLKEENPIFSIKCDFYKAEYEYPLDKKFLSSGLNSIYIHFVESEFPEVSENFHYKKKFGNSVVYFKHPKYYFSTDIVDLDSDYIDLIGEYRFDNRRFVASDTAIAFIDIENKQAKYLQSNIKKILDKSKTIKGNLTVFSDEFHHCNCFSMDKMERTYQKVFNAFINFDEIQKDDDTYKKFMKDEKYPYTKYLKR